MKIGYNEGTMFKASTLAKDLELCEKAGFDYIEVRLDKYFEYLQTHTLDELKRFFAASHIKPHAINGVYISRDLSFDKAETVAAFEKDVVEACEVASSIGAPCFILVSPLNMDRITPWKDPVPDFDSTIVRAAAFAGKIAEKYHLNICFELVGARYSACRSIDRAKKLIEAAGMPNLGYVFDSYNIFLNDCCTDYDKMRTVDLEKIFAVHINDGIEVPVDQLGSQANRRLCGEGYLPLKKYLAVLRDIGYDGMVSIETFCEEYYQESPEKIIPLAYQTTKALMEECGCL